MACRWASWVLLWSVGFGGDKVDLQVTDGGRAQHPRPALEALDDGDARGRNRDAQSTQAGLQRHQGLARGGGGKGGRAGSSRWRARTAIAGSKQTDDDAWTMGYSATCSSYTYIQYNAAHNLRCEIAAALEALEAPALPPGLDQLKLSTGSCLAGSWSWS